MKRYSVQVSMIYDVFVDVEAENEDEAWEKVCKMDAKAICGGETVPVDDLYIPDSDLITPSIWAN